MKKFTAIRLLFLMLFLCSFGILGSCCNNNDSESELIPEPINITIYLDLSDRLIRDLTPSQMDRDTAIIGLLCDWYKEQTGGTNILKSNNKIRVMFYPQPQNAEITKLVQDLTFDISDYKGVNRTIALDGLKSKFCDALSKTYTMTINSSNWIGCDIWDFFSSKKVDQQCIEKEYRNILVILTDGYLYHGNNKIKQGDAFSYILPQTLANPNSTLLVQRDNLSNLEVRIMEINPYKIQDRNPMMQKLRDWLLAMGIKDEDITLAETGDIVSTKKIIHSFLDK